MTLTILGIRHHGPGSARSLLQVLESQRPDILLVEGPPEANELIPLAAHEEMVPPVALLIYAPANPQQAVYYPFAEFSPEWQAIQYGLRKQTPVRFMDLPQANQLQARFEQLAINPEKPDLALELTPLDPFAWIAESTGYSDGERWWEHFVEQRRESGDIFLAILELMEALRAEAEKEAGLVPEIDRGREAAMRRAIRTAQEEGYQKISVVCGAWHAPALARSGNSEDDKKLLEDLPVCEVAATWVPWTYDRLSRRSGYGAGIESPGWYEHIWLTQTYLVEKWMVKAARYMRENDLEISPAHAIEATHLAEALAALREQPLPGLTEINEAVQAIYCMGEDIPMRLIHEKLVVGVRMGSIPPEAPVVPLQRDLSAAQKHTRLEVSALPETIDLDLRKPLLLERSQLLHRLNLLGIAWGELREVRGAKGTFHELWKIEWKPEFTVQVIEASVWGNTVLEAATNKVKAEAAQTDDLPVLTRLVEAALLADLAESIPELMESIQKSAATMGDISLLMEALPPLVNVLRYGNVRQTDTSMVRKIVDELAVRITIGLPPACLRLDDEAAQAMAGRIGSVQNALDLLQEGVHLSDWARALENLASQETAHGLVRGRACQLIFDRVLGGDQTALRMSQALSPGTPPSQSAAWVEGFLKDSGQTLIHNPQLWHLVDDWVLSLSNETFTTVLPLLRRTFSSFSAPELRQIGEMARNGGQATAASIEVELDPARVEKALELVRKILDGTEIK